VERCGVGRDNLMKLVTLGRGLMRIPLSPKSALARHIIGSSRCPSAVEGLRSISS
jgi:hypothetical protein